MSLFGLFTRILPTVWTLLTVDRFSLGNLKYWPCRILKGADHEEIHTWCIPDFGPAGITPNETPGD